MTQKEWINEVVKALQYFEHVGDTPPCRYCGQGVDEDGGSLCDSDCPAEWSHYLLMQQPRRTSRRSKARV